MSEIYLNSLNQINEKELDSVKAKKIDSAIQIIRFYIDNIEFALDIMDVKEIKEMDLIRNLPNSQPFVKGLLNLRGDIIPVLDLKKKLELENLSLEDLAKIGDGYNTGKESKIDLKEQTSEDNSEKEQLPSIIICKVGSEYFGMVVDKIHRVQYLSVDQFEKAPELFESIGKDFIKGFAKVEKKVIVILSLYHLFY